MRTMAKRGFILYNDYAPQFNSLSDEQCGRLIKGIFNYVISGEEPKLTSKAEMAFMFIKNALDENKSKYEDVCKKRSEAGKRSGEVRYEKAMNKINTCSISRTKRTDTDTDTETETETVTETETNTGTVPSYAYLSGGRTGKQWANAQNKERTIPLKLKNAGFDFNLDDIFEQP